MKQQEALTTIKENEFRHGENPDGSLIGAYRNIGYSIFKEKKNPLARGHVDLILTGRFIGSAHIKNLMRGRYSVGFRDGKATKLIEQYGKQIQGLNPETFKKFQIEVIRPRYWKRLKQTARIS